MNAQIEQMEKEAQSKEQELSGRLGERAGKKQAVPDEWLHKYEIMKTRFLIL